MNISEGKEEKYQFYQDLYQKVNKSLLQLKPNFKENYPPKRDLKIFANKNYIPTLINLNKRLMKINNNYILKDNSNFLMKSTSSSNIRNAKPFNFNKK
jgi:hypothetical protein